MPLYFIRPLELAQAVAEDLKSRKMPREVEAIRSYYRSVKARPSYRSQGDLLNAVEWACMLGVEPFESVFLVQPAMHRCSCNQSAIFTRVGVSFAASDTKPTRDAHYCPRCGDHWVVEG